MTNGDSRQRPNLFPPTRHSALWMLKSSDTPERRRGLDVIARAYARPVERYLQIKWRLDSESSRDTTQSFFLTAIEKGYFEEFDPSQARFRTFLRVCVDRFVMKQFESENALKRGGDSEIIRLGDLTDSHKDAITSDERMDALFDQEWARSVLMLSISLLQSKCEESGKQVEFALFARYDVLDHGNNKPTYAQLAGDFGVTESAVTNALAWARREFKSIVFGVVRQLTASDSEYRDEVRALLGVEPE